MTVLVNSPRLLGVISGTPAPQHLPSLAWSLHFPVRSCYSHTQIHD